MATLMVMVRVRVRVRVRDRVRDAAAVPAHERGGGLAEGVAAQLALEIELLLNHRTEEHEVEHLVNTDSAMVSSAIVSSAIVSSAIVSGATLKALKSRPSTPSSGQVTSTSTE